MVYDDVYSSMHIYISDFGYTLSTYYNLHQNVNKHITVTKKSQNRLLSYAIVTQRDNKLHIV